MPLRAVPEGEQFIGEGVISELGRPGGDEHLVPPERRIVIGSALLIERDPCNECGSQFERCDEGTLEVGRMVVVSWLSAHNHYVIRVAD